ncbi:hypothetical protein IQ268_10880 [Oculatella sp. LEGE 06141]|uniref:hypothetical protein n=1 Tax=Oculatella sp. LEGE 06141 TaxID=1828648 RepID=UPI001881001C|nr:hypothetical protein [Oculatella sp. LEGE 06141]MBE9179065.1 hypothetical protein [Oculatella sp. LEGE 06141]
MKHPKEQTVESAHHRVVSEFNLYSETLETFPAATGLEADGIIVLIPLSFLAIWALLVSIVSDLFLPDKEEKAPPANTIAKSPCHKCQFFSDNPYLKCAVQPTLVFTTQSRNCPDYAPMSASSRLKSASREA